MHHRCLYVRLHVVVLLLCVDIYRSCSAGCNQSKYQLVLGSWGSGNALINMLRLSKIFNLRNSELVRLSDNYN